MILSEEELQSILLTLKDMDVTHEMPRVYSDAVRRTLETLGYEEEWIEEHLREACREVLQANLDAQSII